MRFIFFRTPKPKRFNYKPRYYNEDKERFERRKAELGYDSSLPHKESLRLRMDKRWKRSDGEYHKNQLSRFVYYGFYAFVIIGGIYLIFFTDFVDKLVAFFGVGK